MRDLLPRVEVDLDALRRGSLFAAGREVWLEIGFGGGEHLLARALERPDVGFIGCEPFVNGVAKLLAGIEAHGLDNVRVRSDDALALIDAAPEAAFSRIYLLYPDPWPKRRQQKRRFVSQANIALLARVLKPGGELRFATDIDDYAGWTLTRFLASPSFTWEAACADDWRAPWHGWAPTRYEAKARREGRGSAYLTFRRR
jgi:tRNA (guanine-N7-)-methyltransferase